MPSLPSNEDFRDILQAMSVEGVETHFDYPPASIQPSDLPVAFPTLPGATLGERLVSCADENWQRTRGYVICLEAAMLDTNEQNYELLDPAMDNLEDALQDSFSTRVNFYDVNIGTGTYTVGGHNYWGVIASVTIRSY